MDGSESTPDLGAYRQDDVLNGISAWSRGRSGGVAELSVNEVADEARENALLYGGILHGQTGAVVHFRTMQKEGGKQLSVS